MKIKFLLTLLTHGLLVGLISTAADATPTTDSLAETLRERDLMSLSQTISRTIGFDRDTDSLVELAIDRALVAQQVNNRSTEMRTAGVPLSPQDSRYDKKPLIDGKIPAPTNRSIGQAKHKKTTTPKLLQPSILDRVTKIDRQ